MALPTASRVLVPCVCRWRSSSKENGKIPILPGRPRNGPPFFVCRACSIARRCKSSTQPDGGEELAKRKGVLVTEGLKEARSKGASRWTRTGSEAYGAGRAGN